MKIRPVGAELFHADGQTDVAKLTVAFRNFANAPKNYSLVKKETSFCTKYKFKQTLVNKRIYKSTSSFLYFCFIPKPTAYPLLDLLLLKFRGSL
jgi:hypothetical protein